MNQIEAEQRFAERMKKCYPPGTRIELISIDDPYIKIAPGTRGTVQFVDDIGTIHPAWDTGSSLGLVPGEDSFRKLTQEEIDAETAATQTSDQDGGMHL